MPARLESVYFFQVYHAPPAVFIVMPRMLRRLNVAPSLRKKKPSDVTSTPLRTPTIVVVKAELFMVQRKSEKFRKG